MVTMIEVGFRGKTGPRGWGMILSAEPYLGGVVLRVADWIGVSGTKPAVGQYLGPDGLVDDIDDATLFASVQLANTALAAANTALQAAQAAAVLTAGDRIATGEDRVATGQDRVATGQDVVTAGQHRVQTGLDRTATGEDRVQTGLDRTQTGLDRTQTNADRGTTTSDRIAVAADRVDVDAIWASLTATPLVISGTTYTLQASDQLRELQFTNAAGCVVTLPNSPARGWRAFACRMPGAGEITWALGAGSTLVGTAPAGTKISQALGTVEFFVSANAGAAAAWIVRGAII